MIPGGARRGSGGGEAPLHRDGRPLICTGCAFPMPGMLTLSIRLQREPGSVCLAWMAGEGSLAGLAWAASGWCFHTAVLCSSEVQWVQWSSLYPPGKVARLGLRLPMLCHCGFCTVTKGEGKQQQPGSPLWGKACQHRRWVWALSAALRIRHPVRTGQGIPPQQSSLWLWVSTALARGASPSLAQQGAGQEQWLWGSSQQESLWDCEAAVPWGSSSQCGLLSLETRLSGLWELQADGAGHELVGS